MPHTTPVTIKLLLNTSWLLLTLSSSLLNATSAFTDAEIFHGERLFLETRFAYLFYGYLGKDGDVNVPLKHGDPKLEKTYRFFGLPPYQIPFAESPFKGTSFSCRTCHMVDEHVKQKELGMRNYADFASKSPVTERDDNRNVTVRNSPILIGTSINHDNFLLHFDGEFSTMEDLIVGTMTGRNLGWKPTEKEIALEHICRVINEDNGKDNSAKDFGELSYKEVFLGKDKDGKLLPEEYLINEENRFDISKSPCNKIIEGVTLLIKEYVVDLQFSKDEVNLSPYDLFLLTNNLPSAPADDETDKEYSSRLLSLIEELRTSKKLKFISKNPNTENGGFQFHDQAFKFGEIELKGLEIFFNRATTQSKGVGNCTSCHPPPHFTDFGFHNIGITQVEYEAIHGPGSFQRLKIPSYKERNEQANLYLPATTIHPTREGMFRRAPSKENALEVDLGAWNIFFNEDYPKPQEKLYKLICSENEHCKTEDQALMRSIARFKTPSLRNLGHSAPYMHNGQISDLHAVLAFYVTATLNDRNQKIRNPDQELSKIKITPNDIEPLVRFLISLYEDYQ